MISVAENSNKFQKTRFWNKNSVEDVVALGPTAQATLVNIKFSNCINYSRNATGFRLVPQHYSMSLNQCQKHASSPLFIFFQPSNLLIFTLFQLLCTFPPSFHIFTSIITGCISSHSHITLSFSSYLAQMDKKFHCRKERNKISYHPFMMVPYLEDDLHSTLFSPMVSKL